VRLTEPRARGGEAAAQKVTVDVARRPETPFGAAGASVVRPLSRTIPEPVWVKPLPSMARPEDGATVSQDGAPAALQDRRRGPDAGDVVPEQPSAAPDPAAHTAVEPVGRPGTTANFGRVGTPGPSASRTMSVESPPPVVRRPESTAEGQSPSEEWARIREEAGQLAQEAKAAGRQIAGGVRQLGSKIKQIFGAD
jgi:hypothetical protein